MSVILDEVRVRPRSALKVPHTAEDLAPADPNPDVPAAPRQEIYDGSELRRERRFLGDDAFSEIGSSIASGVLEDGELLRDRELAEQMGISRTPVREAILQLQQIGLVEILPSRRTRVTPLTRQIAEDCRRWAGYCGGIAARQAIPTLSPMDAETAVSRIDALLGAIGSPAEAATAALELLLFLSARAGSPILHAEITERQFSLLRALRRLSYSAQEVEAARVGSRDLASAIARRDSDGAEVAMRSIFGIR
ncbi:GntR family transcriptional regulator [Microbacterium sp. NPDC090003]|uniref:GntR family transcriptional regulator n=1 Tax=Microbacterium sp. NPDC090003 TaxID=3364203 RepID=UPI00380D8A62